MQNLSKNHKQAIISGLPGNATVGIYQIIVQWLLFSYEPVYVSNININVTIQQIIQFDLAT